MQIKQAELAEKQADREIKLRELALKEIELEQNGRLQQGDLAARVDNIRADTRLKDANADKSMTEAASNAVEISETFNKRRASFPRPLS